MSASYAYEPSSEPAIRIAAALGWASPEEQAHDLDRVETDLADALYELDFHRRALDEIKAIHEKSIDVCACCWTQWPCATLRVLLSGPSFVQTDHDDPMLFDLSAVRDAVGEDEQ